MMMMFGGLALSGRARSALGAGRFEPASCAKPTVGAMNGAAQQAARTSAIKDWSDRAGLG
jgi:hypothetical protein